MSSSLLPSANALIPLFTLHASWGETPDYRVGDALRWFLLASGNGRYSGAAISSLNEDVQAIKEARSFAETLEALLKRLRVDSKVEAAEFLMVSGYEPQWHHIYPRSLLRNAGVSEDDIHALANITVLNERTNVNKLSGKPPWRYIEQFKLSRD